MMPRGSQIGGASRAHVWGQISDLPEYVHAIYQIERIDVAITLEHLLSKSDDYAVQDGRHD